MKYLDGFIHILMHAGIIYERYDNGPSKIIACQLVRAFCLKRISGRFWIGDDLSLHMQEDGSRARCCTPSRSSHSQEHQSLCEAEQKACVRNRKCLWKQGDIPMRVSFALYIDDISIRLDRDQVPSAQRTSKVVVCPSEGEASLAKASPALAPCRHGPEHLEGEVRHTTRDGRLYKSWSV